MIAESDARDIEGSVFLCDVVKGNQPKTMCYSEHEIYGEFVTGS